MKSLKTREERSKLYKTGLWVRMRKRILSERPLCEWCLKEHKLNPSVVLDHASVWNTVEEFYKPEKGWNALCLKHHREKLDDDIVEKRRKEMLKIKSF